VVYTGAVTDTDPHGLLGVSPGAAPDVLRRAWLEAVRAAHPDRVQSEGAAAVAAAEARTQAINAAYAHLRRESAPPVKAASGAPPSALEALRQATNLVGHAEQAVDAAHQLAQAFRSARHSATGFLGELRRGAAAMEAERVSAEAAVAAVQPTVTEVLVEAMAGPVGESADEAEGAAEEAKLAKVSKSPGADARYEEALARARVAANAAQAAFDAAPEQVGTAAVAAWGAGAQHVEAAEAATRTAERQLRRVASASSRVETQRTAGRRALERLEIAAAKATPLADEALRAAAVAAALARTELAELDPDRRTAGAGQAERADALRGQAEAVQVRALAAEASVSLLADRRQSLDDLQAQAQALDASLRANAAAVQAAAVAAKKALSEAPPLGIADAEAAARTALERAFAAAE
jgi:hypothetical protein